MFSHRSGKAEARWRNIWCPVWGKGSFEQRLRAGYSEAELTHDVIPDEASRIFSSRVLNKYLVLTPP